MEACEGEQAPDRNSLNEALRQGQTLPFKEIKGFRVAMAKLAEEESDWR